MVDQPNSETRDTVLLQGAELRFLKDALAKIVDNQSKSRCARAEIIERIDNLRAEILKRDPLCSEHTTRLGDAERRVGDTERDIKDLSAIQKGWAGINTLLALIAGALGVRQS